MRTIKAPRFSIFHKPHIHAGNVDLIVTMFSFLPFNKPFEPMLENEAWPEIAALLGDIPLDTFDLKARGEWLAWGDACAPEGTQVQELDVSISCGENKKLLSVIGDREWIAQRWRSISMTEPRMFDRISIKSENAFGGNDFKDNPSGKGYWPKKLKPEKYPLPNILFPESSIEAPGDTTLPGYFSPRDIMLPERQKYAGTYDKEWAETIFPGLPDDFDLNFYQVAQTDQQLDGFFDGQETFEIENMHPTRQRQTIALPGIRARAFVTINRTNEEQSFEDITMHTDTVWLFPEIEVAVVINRGTLPAESMDLAEIESLMGAFEWSHDKPRPLDYYRICRDDRSAFETMAEAFGRPEELYPEKWVEPEDEIFGLIKPRDPTLTSDGTPRMDALWAKQKGIIDEGLAAQGLGSYDEFVAANKSVTDDPEIKAITNELDDLKNMKPKTAQELQQMSKKVDKLRGLVEQTVKKQTNAAEIHFRKECEFFGFDYDQLRSVAATTPKDPSEVKGFVTAELNRIVNDTKTPEAIRAAAKEAIPSLAQVDIEKKLEKAAEMDTKAKSLFGHILPKAPSLNPALNVDLKDSISKSIEEDKSMQGRDFAGADLSDLKFEGANFKNVDFNGAILRGTIFRNCNLENACFAHADLTGAKFLYCSADSTNFGLSVLDEAHLFFCKLGSSNFSKAIGKNTKFSYSLMRLASFSEANLVKPEFIKADLMQARFMDSELESAWFNEAYLESALFMNTNVKTSVFSKANGANIVFIGGDFSGSDFSDVVFKQCTTVNDVILDRCKFQNASIKETNFRGSSFVEADFSDAILTKSDFSETNLQEANFSRAFARESRFHRAQILHVNFSGADLMDGNFLLARMEDCEVSEANFFSADFMKAELENNNFDRANVQRTRIEGFRFP
ncbi:MAG: DUF2169 domain-containing protein [Thalassobaculaceae bacterium]